MTPRTGTWRGGRVATLLVLAAALAAGCGDDGLGRRYQVRGTVSYNDKPLEKGMITFAPVEPEGRAASGEIEKGSYSLTTMTPGDGALPGRYKVTVAALEVDDSKVLENAKGGAANQIDVIKSTVAAKRLIPAKYEAADTSGLEATVKEETNTIDFKLTD